MRDIPPMFTAHFLSGVPDLSVHQFADTREGMLEGVQARGESTREGASALPEVLDLDQQALGDADFADDLSWGLGDLAGGGYGEE